MFYTITPRVIHKAVALLRDSSDPQYVPIFTNDNNSLGLSLDLLGDERTDNAALHDIPSHVSSLVPEHSDESCEIKCSLDSNALSVERSEVKTSELECGSESVAPVVAALENDINECEFTEVELDEPAHTLSPRALYFQRLRSADTQEEARDRSAYLLANPPAPRVFDTPPHSLYVRRPAIALGLHSPLRESVTLSESFDVVTSSTKPSWSDHEELEDLDSLKMFFNSPPGSPSIIGKAEIVQPQSPAGSWSDEEDEELEGVEELENFFKCGTASHSMVFPC